MFHVPRGVQLTKIGALLLFVFSTALGFGQAAPPPASTVAAATAETDKDVSWKARDEIARRGAMVERINGFQAVDEAQALLVEALAPPPDDSYKWCITLVTTKGCTWCEKLRGDFDQSPSLTPWVNTKEYTKSWAHWQVVQIEDQSQAWRWKDYKPKTFPTLILQPPFNQSWGDPHTIVMLQEGYEKPDKLAIKLRAAIDKYAAKVKPQRAAWKSLHAMQVVHDLSGGGMEQAGAWTPPATPPAPLGPVPYSPTTIPPTPPEPQPLTLEQVQKASPDADAKFWIDELAKNYTDPNKVAMDWLLKKMEQPKPATPATNPPSNVAGLVALVLTLLGGGSLGGLLVFGLTAFRRMRKAAGQTLLIPSDASFQELMTLLQSLGHNPLPVPPATPGISIAR